MYLRKQFLRARPYFFREKATTVIKLLFIISNLKITIFIIDGEIVS